jgi:hypothetical protein
MSQQSRDSRKQNKKAMGFRVDPELDAEIRDYAKKTERPITQILHKVIRLGWPVFLKNNKGA